MTKNRRVEIRTLPTGVPGLDEVLRGGLPEFSFNVIAGEPGSGKTTLAQQILFANATPERSALYFTVLGEPLIKMLRYQQQYTFFDAAKVGGVVRYVNLSAEVLEHDLEKVLERITLEVEATSPGIVVVDSFRTVVRSLGGAAPTDRQLQSFIQRLGLQLTSWQATSFLVGEYSEGERQNNPIFTVADGLFWLSQAVDRNSVVRKLQVVKSRGQAPMPGLHTLRITDEGVRVFPRSSLAVAEADRVTPRGRISTGVGELDEMMAGGIPAGDSVLVSGPSGSGKSVLATQFIAEGVRTGESGVLIVFEEHPKEYLYRAKGLGFDLERMVEQGKLEIIYLRPLDLSPDEALHAIRQAAARLDAKRVVIDSMSGFEVALAPTFRTDFRESLYRLIGALTGVGITVLTTMEVVQDQHALQFTPNAVSFLADDMISLRYVEIGGELRKTLTVVKMRGSQHGKAFREFEITSEGLRLLGRLDGYRGSISGATQLSPGAG